MMFPVSLIAFTFIGLASGELLIISPDNETEVVMVDLELQFTAPLPEEGLMGQIVTADPEEACAPIKKPPFATNSSLKWFALIRRCPCPLEQKVRYAQQAGFHGAVIYNVGPKCQSQTVNGNQLLDSDISIPGVLIGESDGKQINQSYQYDKKYVVVINPESPFSLNNYLLPFAVVIGVCFIVMLLFMIVKCIKDRRRNRRNRLSSKHLKQLPIKKFKKGDEYDVCAICLEDYCEGDKLRILPCSHAYHTKCIDPWLTDNRRTCPVCKRKVALKGVTSDDDSDSDAESTSERTPLIHSSDRSRAHQTDGGTFSGSAQRPASHLENGGLSTSYLDSDCSSENGEMYQSAVGPSFEQSENSIVVASSSQLLAPVSHSINSEDGFEGSRVDSSQGDEQEVASVHVQQPVPTTEGNKRRKKHELVV